MKPFAIIAVLLLCGCANISHNRNSTITTVDTNGLKTVTVKHEKEGARFFFQSTAAANAFTTTSENGSNYLHKAGATNLHVTGDVDLVKAVGEAVSSSLGAAAGTAAKTAAKP